MLCPKELPLKQQTWIWHLSLMCHKIYCLTHLKHSASHLRDEKGKGWETGFAVSQRVWRFLLNREELRSYPWCKIIEIQQSLQWWERPGQATSVLHVDKPPCKPQLNTNRGTQWSWGLVGQEHGDILRSEFIWMRREVFIYKQKPLVFCQALSSFSL